MKSQKTIGLLIIIILTVSLLLQDYSIINKVQEENDKEDIGSLFYSSNLFAYEWSLVWGGNDYEYCEAIALDSSGNIYLAGYSYKGGNFDMCLVKFDSSGDYQWNHTLGGIFYDFAYSIALDTSDNIYLAGSTSISGVNDDMCLVKFSNSGDYQGNITWGGSDNERCLAMTLDSSGNIFLAGTIQSDDDDMCLVKFNNLGVYQWNRTWDGSNYEYCEAIALDSSDNIYIAGYTEIGEVDADMCLVKFNALGELQWNRTWGGSDYEYCKAIALDSSGNIYLAGYNYNGGNNDMRLVKFNNSGECQWNRTLGGSLDDEVAFAIALDSSDNIYLGGYKEIIDHACFFVVCDSLGFPQWNHTWDIPSSNDRYRAIAFDSSENIYLAGMCSDGDSDMCLAKFNAHPKILINSPDQSEFFGIDAPRFNISILESEINTMHYTLDGGITNITFSRLTGKINQTEWNKKGNGTVTIRFYANDSMGLKGTSEVSIYKDTIAPTSSISYIVYKEPNMVNKSTTFTLTADDESGAGVSVIRYKINDSEWLEYNSSFDLSLYAYGDLLISYHAIDEVGNIEGTNTVLVALVEVTEKPAEGVPLVIILVAVLSSVAGITVVTVTIILLRKRKKNIPKESF